MKDGDMPWREFASAVGKDAASSERMPSLLFEGPLIDVATTLGRWKTDLLADVRVSLPDRHVPPRIFAGAALLDLIERARIVRGREALEALDEH